MPLLPLFLFTSSSASELVSLLFLSLFLRLPSPSHGHLPWFWIQAASSSALFTSEAPATRGHPMLGHPELGTPPYICSVRLPLLGGSLKLWVHELLYSLFHLVPPSII